MPSATPSPLNCRLFENCHLRQGDYLANVICDPWWKLGRPSPKLTPSVSVSGHTFHATASSSAFGTPTEDSDQTHDLTVERFDNGRPTAIVNTTWIT